MKNKNIKSKYNSDVSRAAKLAADSTEPTARNFWQEVERQIAQSQSKYGAIEPRNSTVK